MARIQFVSADGEAQWIDAAEGRSLMEVALDAGIAGIEGQCGGFLNCATCHVFIDEAWRQRVADAGEEESELLEGTVEPSRPSSRLSCQIVVTKDLDGLRVSLPQRQS